jgi:hypothetical protein
MDRWINWDKGDFIGRAAALAERDGNGPAQKVVTLEVDATDADASGFEPVWKDGNLVGFVTSGGYGHTLGKSLAMAMPAETITEAVCNVFRCFVDDDLFNTRLDFAVREWARRSGGVRKRLDRSDETRLDALTGMFARHGFDPRDAETRARVLYYMQIGYTFAELNEPLEVRLARVPDYLLAFTGQRPQPGEVDALSAYSRNVMETTK